MNLDQLLHVTPKEPLDAYVNAVGIWAYASSIETLPHRLVAETSGAVAIAVLKEVERRCLELSDFVDKNTAYVLKQMQDELTKE